MTNTDRLRRDFTLTWMLDAPPAEVFQAWTDPDHLHWFYNDSNPVPTEPIEVDLRIGGTWRQHMVIDRTTAYVTGGVYREIVPDEKRIFSWDAPGHEHGADRSADRARVCAGDRGARSDRLRRQDIFVMELNGALSNPFVTDKKPANQAERAPATAL